MAETGFEWMEIYSDIASKIRKDHSLGEKAFTHLAKKGLLLDFLRDSNNPFSLFTTFNYWKGEEKRIEILNEFKTVGLLDPTQ